MVDLQKAISDLVGEFGSIHNTDYVMQLITTSLELGSDKTSTLDLKIASSFHLLKHGQKDGPYTVEDLKNMIKERELLLTDEVSGNNGKSWLKLFMLPDFDRRSNPAEHDELPFRPEEQAFNYQVEEKTRRKKIKVFLKISV